MDVNPEEIITREYRAGDEKQIVELLEEVFEEWPIVDVPLGNQSFWDWKYQDNYTDRKVIAISDYRGKIVGAGHIYTHSMKMFDENFLLGVGADGASLVEFSGMGLNRKRMSFIARAHKNVETLKKWCLNIAV